MRVTVAEIVQATNGTLATEDVDSSVLATGFTWDSRAVEPGDLYVALPGERVDGHDFAAAAVEGGAVAVLASRAVDVKVPVVLVADTQAAFADLARYWRTRLAGTVVGLTGSTGKTTTKNLVRDVLSAAGTVVATKANQNNELGVPATLLSADEDTDFVVVEMGMRGPGQIAALCDIAQPDWGLVTNVGESHIELLGSRQNIACAKAELLEALPQGGLAFVNASDEFAGLLVERSGLLDRAGAVVLFGGAGDLDAYGIAACAAVFGEDVVLDELARPTFTLVARVRPDRLAGADTLSRSDSPRFGEQSTGLFQSLRNSLGEHVGAGEAPDTELGEARPDRFGSPDTLSRSDSPRLVKQSTGLFQSLRNSLGEHAGRAEALDAGLGEQCRLGLAGVHNVSNACAAAAVGLAAGLTLDQVVGRLQDAVAEKGRQQVLATPRGATVVDDAYNANPDSMRASLATFAALGVRGRRIAVLGDMGELGAFAPDCHLRVGSFAAAADLDALLCVGELSKLIAQGAVAAGMDASRIVTLDTVEQALGWLDDALAPGDAVLVKASHFMEFSTIVERLVG